MKDAGDDTTSITGMTDSDLIEHVTRQAEVSPLENELVHRLEIYVATFGDLQLGDDI